MKRAICVVTALVFIGCQKADPRPTAAPLAAAAATTPAAGIAAPAAEAPEEFEGVVELFGFKIRARRQVKLDERGNYVKHGRAVGWYESGQKAGEMWFRDNLPHGSQRVWHENGIRKLIGQSENGLAAGRWTEWYDNGQKQSEGSYVAGQKHGIWTFWDASGHELETVEYRHGEKVRLATRPSSTR